MKNTLIRGVNNIYATAQFASTKSLTTPFLRYTLAVCNMLCVHVQGPHLTCPAYPSTDTIPGDQMFSTLRNAHGKSLVDFLGTADSYAQESSALLEFIKGLESMLLSWTQVCMRIGSRSKIY
ncbi:hypothetical protein H0H81_010261 [Sphagnurus paluster]|uniref:Uncharacterized protein n=1 Tax=Sphagnurus paluster TaxID=117069 RepID=A0A9P7GI19_9AGAR|nr:hypothetical protein H0H81_010261 [Sphagnurus paluster]